MHPVDKMYDDTRVEWRRYRDAATPWPKDRDERAGLVRMRLRVTQERISILERAPKDDRVSRELRTQRALLRADRDFLELAN